MPEQVRNSLIVWETLKVLRDATEPLTSNAVMDAVRKHLQPTAYENERVKSGGVRWEVALHFLSGDAVTIGWMTKRGGWSILRDGAEALEAFTGPELLYSELSRRY